LKGNKKMEKTEQIKVVKFGGSSLADASQFKKVADIVKAEKSRHYVVPSAPGKRFNEDEKVTDLLYACYRKATAGENFSAEWKKVQDRYNGIISDLSLPVCLENEFLTIQEHLMRDPQADYVASRGEYLNGILLASYLGFDFVDAADVIFFQENGHYDVEKTTEVMTSVLKQHEYAVIPGFYGRAADGTIKTFSRGGSDITGSIVALVAKAVLYENWTDVSGFLMADPRIVENPKIIETVTYSELRELSYMGATVLHEEAVFPVREAGIPINIRNTNRPEDPGTRIVLRNHVNRMCEGITGIAGKKGFSVINIEKDMMNNEVGFCRKVLAVLERYGISFEHLPSGIDAMGIVVASASLNANRQAVIEEIRQAVQPDTIYVEDGLSLVAVVGQGMVRNVGTAARIISAVSASGVNIRMMDQGTRENNIILSVEEADFEKTVRVIYSEFE
jgi:aspartate kinase